MDPQQPTPDVAQAQVGSADPDVYMYDENAAVPLNRLKPQSEKIDCPYCKQTDHTRVEKTGEGGNLQSFLFWPLPNRRHWFEWTHWYCKNCDNEVAKQKWGKKLTVLPPGGN